MFRARIEEAIAALSPCSLPTLLILSVSLPSSADEFYDKEGIITSLDSCLQIAGEPGAADLRGRIVDAADLADSDGDPGLVLDKLGDHRPTRAQGEDTADAEHAYGILLMCAHIVRAWEQYGAARPWSDPAPGAIETWPAGSGFDPTHQALVLAFHDRTLRRLRIPPGPLARLLATPTLLPSAYVGGLVIKDAIVDGPLLLNHAAISGALTFTNVVFSGGDYSKEILGEPKTQRRAVSMLGVRFDDQVSFVRSTFCGDVMIKDAHFAERLLIRRANESRDGCAAPGMDRSASNTGARPLRASLGKCEAPEDRQRRQTVVSVIGSRFGIGLSVTDSWIDRLSFNGSQVGSLYLVDNLFDELAIIDNSIGTSSLTRNVISREAQIIVNRLEGDLWVEDEAYDPASEPLKIKISYCSPDITIANNKIGGGLGFIRRPEYFTSRDVDLRSNVAENGSEIRLPATWRGELDLSGSQFLGTLELASSSSSPPGDREQFCSSRDRDQMQREDAFGRVGIDLTGVGVRMLSWNLPFTCEYLWQGTGLRYEVWDRTASLQAWRTLLKEPRPDELNTISSYLSNHGQYNAGRKILVEAKRLNYAPGCAPDRWLLGCFLTSPTAVVGATEAGMTAIASAGDDAGPATDTRSTQASAWYDPIILVLLWPAGYGAAPERALFLLAIAPVLCWLGYAYYSRQVARTTTDERLLANEDRVVNRWRTAVGQFDLHELTKSDRERLEDIKFAFETARKNKFMMNANDFERIERDLLDLGRKHGLSVPSLNLVDLHTERRGNSSVPGFSQFDKDRLPRRFSLFLYSLDSMLPVVDLHHYSSYYPEWGLMRGVAVVQHICGWWWSTVFIAAAAIL